MDVNVPQIASEHLAVEDASSSVKTSTVSNRSLIYNHSIVKLWKGFEQAIAQTPYSVHGRMIIPWDKEARDYNLKDIYYYKPPNLSLSDANTVLGE